VLTRHGSPRNKPFGRVAAAFDLDLLFEKHEASPSHPPGAPMFL
jgi:hypothetical protein